MRDFSEALIERYSSPESFRRGQGYYRQCAVASLVVRGQELRAEVAGSQFAPRFWSESVGSRWKAGRSGWRAGSGTLVKDLVGDAIAAVEGDPFGALIARVADAAIESHPEWVIETCRRQAEEIMNQGRSKDCVDWLEKVQDAHLAAGREEEWVA